MRLAVSSASARPAAPIHPQPISPPPTRLALAGAARQEGQEGRRWEEGRQGKAKSGFEWASSFELKPFESAELRSLAETLVSTYQV